MLALLSVPAMHHAHRAVARVVILQPAAVAADPDLPGTVQQESANLSVAEAGRHRRIRRVPPQDPTAGRIEHHHAAESAQP